MSHPSDILTHNLAQLENGTALARQLAEQLATDITLGLTDEGKAQLLVQGHSIYHPDEPVVSAAQEIENFWAKQKEPDLVVFFGLGLGLHTTILRQKIRAPILVYEPSLGVLSKVMSEVPMDLAGITLVTNLGHLIHEAGKTISPTRNKLAVGAIPTYRDLFPRPFEDFRAALSQVMRKVEIDLDTRSFFSHQWVSHLAANLPRLVQAKPLHALGENFQGRPGILVGAGPSLDDNIDDLAAAQGKALICAVHTAVMPLSAAGITPDLVVIIEGHKLDYFFKGVDQMDGMVLVPGPQTHPIHLDLGFKDILAISTEGHAAADWFEQAYGFEPLASGGSVACTAFSLLSRLGCDPIILVGMDAAFTHGRTHSLKAETGCCRVKYDGEKNSIAFTYQDNRIPDGFWNGQHVPAWGGLDKVLTRPVYSSFRHWFESASQTWAGHHHLINATEGGARFEGFEEMTLTEALALHGKDPLPATQYIQEALSSDQALDPNKLGQAIRGELDIILHAATAAGKADKAAQKALRQLRARQLTTLQPLLDKLAVHEKTLQELTPKTRLLNTMIGHRVSAISMGGVDGQPSPAPNDQMGQTMASIEKSRAISQLVMEGASELEKMYGPIAARFLG